MVGLLPWWLGCSVKKERRYYHWVSCLLVKTCSVTKAHFLKQNKIWIFFYLMHNWTVHFTSGGVTWENLSLVARCHSILTSQRSSNVKCSTLHISTLHVVLYITLILAIWKLHECLQSISTKLLSACTVYSVYCILMLSGSCRNTLMNKSDCSIQSTWKIVKTLHWTNYN